MEQMINFMEQYDGLKKDRPELFLKIEQPGSGLPRWRIHVYAREAGRGKGDAELACAEHKDREEAFRQAAIRMRDTRERIERLEEYNR